MTGDYSRCTGDYPGIERFLAISYFQVNIAGITFV